MSGFRRNIMAEIANRSFIEGYCNVYNSTFTFYLNFTNSASGTLTQITVNTDSNGHWRYKLTNGQKVTYMNNAFSWLAYESKLVSVNFSKKFCESVRSWRNTFGNELTNTYACTTLVNVTIPFCNHIADISYICHRCTALETFNAQWNITANTIVNSFYGCNNLRSVNVADWQVANLTSISRVFHSCFSLESDLNNPFDLSCWNTANLQTFDFIFGSLYSEANSWYSDKGWRVFSKLKDIRMFDLPDNCANISNFIRLYGGQDNFDIASIGYITNQAITFEQSSLNLQSAINILSALTDLQGGSATLTFSSSTSALVQADTTAMNLVAQAQANGWTITFN